MLRCHVEQCALALGHHKQVVEQPPLRRQQGREPDFTLGQRLDIVSQQALQEAAPVRPVDGDHGPAGEVRD